MSGWASDDPEVKPNTFWRGFRCAGAGLVHLVRTQRNAQVQLAAGILAVALGLVLGLSLIEWAVLVVVMGMVLSAEAFNTVVEVAIDMATEGRYSEGARIAKDVAAGAVLITAITALLVGALLFIPRLLHLVAGWQ